MAVLYITSEYEGEGKTAIGVSLAQMLRNMGKMVAAFKPFADEGNSDGDAAVYQNLLGQSAEGLPLEVPERGLNEQLAGKAKSVADGLSRAADVVIVEGSSRLTASGHKQLAQTLDAQALVVATYHRGLSSGRLKSWEAVFGDRLVGVIINGLTRYSGHDARNRLLPALQDEGLDILGIVPEDRRLLGVTVAQLAEHLNGRFVEPEEEGKPYGPTNGSLDVAEERLIEHLMVGPMMLNNSRYYFGLHESKAAIVRGDRPDLQMGALHTKTACLVATKGIVPIEYIRNEAALEDVPIMVVDADTLGTMAALNTLQDRAQFDHPLKVERMLSLIEAHVDTARIFGRLGVGG